MRHLTKRLGLAAATAAAPAIAVLCPFPGAAEAPPAVTPAQSDTAGDRSAEADRLLEQGIRQFSVSQFSEALQSWEQALAIYREIGDRQNEGRTLNNLGSARSVLGQYPQAIDYHRQALAITRDIGDRQAEGSTLSNLGNAYFSLGQYPQAIDYQQQALAIARETGNRRTESRTLNNLGLAYFSLGQYPQAIDYQQQALAITRDIGDRYTEGRTLGNLGLAYFSLGQYPQAIDYQQQALAIARDIGDRQTEGRTLGDLGLAYFSLGQYPQAIDYYQQALTITRDIGDRQFEGGTLNNLGLARRALGQYQRAIDYHQQALAITRDIGDRQTEGRTLGNLGSAYFLLGQYPQAIDYHQQALTITRDIGDRQFEGGTLNNLGLAHRALGQYLQAIDYYQQALNLSQAIGDRPSTGASLSNIGRTLTQIEQPELAVAFLKASVEVRESIRDDIQTLDTDLQQSYTDTIADDYRFLADLLLQQGRIPEAQQVLDLLKLEELRQFTDTTRATWTGTDLTYTDPEQAVIAAHGSLIALGGEVIACEGRDGAPDCADLDALYDQLDALKAQYDAQVAEFTDTVRANRSDDDIFTDPDNLSGDAEALLTAYAQDGQNALLIYPFVLDDKLWLVWAAAGGVIGSIEVPVTQGQLASTVQRFGELLQSGSALTLSDLQATSNQLHQWLIAPIEAEIERYSASSPDAAIDHLIFVNDRVTRYIPMAALFDGERYLIERYRVSTVLAPALTDTTERLTGIDESQVLGLGLTQAIADFDPLPAVADELDAIVRSSQTDATGIYPGQVHTDDAFTLDTLKANVRGHRVLHLATHAAFVPGRAEESYILLGNGDRLKVADIEAMERRLQNLHLVVLSACQTALGGTAGDGTEIAGISSYFLEQGRAETVIASLWSVSDDSTSLLMQRFYELLASGELTKAEALRQAQLSLFYDEDTETRLAASRGDIEVVYQNGAPATSRLAHPYHWAPFILIGNGL